MAAHSASSLPLREVAKSRSSATIRSLRDAEANKLTTLAERVEALRQERELRKKSDPDVTTKILADFDEREHSLLGEIGRTEEIVAALTMQLDEALDQEWLARKKKRLEELQREHGTESDADYAECKELLKKLFANLSRQHGRQLAAESFNTSSDDRVGYVMLAEYRIRHSAPGGLYLSPLWKELPRMPPVFPGDDYFELDPPKTSVVEEISPRKVAEAAEAAAARQQRWAGKSFSLQPVFHTLRRAAAEPAPAEQSPTAPQSLNRIVHRTSSGPLVEQPERDV